MVAIGLVLTGCGSSGAPRPVAHSPSTVPPAETTAPQSPAASPTPSSAQSIEPSPFATQSLLPLDPRNKGSKVVSFPSTDGIKLTGRMYGGGPHGVVLAPSGNVRYSQFEWLAAAVKLARAGYHVLTFNVRGVCYPPDPNVGCSEGEIDWANAWQDVAGAVAFLRSQGAKTVAMMGADLGATEAMDAISKGTKVDALVSVSGLNDTEGYEIDSSVLSKVTAPKLFIAGKDDTDAADAYVDWMKQAPRPKQGMLLNTDIRGTFIFDPLGPSDMPQARRTLAAVEQFLQAND
jgi:alpha/beta superfamily hydrolase